jgi:AAA family ATP:ADP antiporter
MNSLIVNDPNYVAPAALKKKEKHAMSVVDGFKVIFSSKYLGFIFILVLCYGISINLIEGPLKDAARKLYPTPVEYATAFMGKLTFYMGISTMAAYLISAQILKRVSWFTGAALTPLMLFISGMGFFLFLIFDKSIEHITSALFVAMHPLQIAVACGMIQNICTKATKYSFFDPTKEMAYIPVGVELQTKGKAAVDVVGARLAKSFGAAIQSTIFIIFPTVGFIQLAPYFMVIFGVLSLIWLVDIKLLYNEYRKFVDHRQ